jgi:SAM-dependent methyltransferase
MAGTPLSWQDQKVKEGESKMRDNIRYVVQSFGKYVQLPEPIIEFGSFQVSDQIGYADMRPFFPGRQYIGCDMLPGVGVDRIENLHNLTFPNDYAGTVITMETMEHVENPFKALDEIYRILKPGGFLLLSSHMHFPIHNYPSDYWRFTPAGFYVLLNKFPVRKVFSQGIRVFPHTILGVAIKGSDESALDLFKISLQGTPGEPVEFEPENPRADISVSQTAGRGKYMKFKDRVYRVK